MIARLFLGLCLACLAMPESSTAAELTGRLKRIKENSVIVIAHTETTMPFSYVHGGGPIGFGVDISKRIATAISRHLNLPGLRIRWNPMTLSTRFPLVVTDTIDLECSTTTHTRAREAIAGFSTTIYISDDGFATRRDSGIRQFGDLNGKRIAVARKTTTEDMVRSKLPGATVLSQGSNHAAMRAVIDGQADAFVAAVPILAGQLLRVTNADFYRIVTIGDAHEAFACMLPKDDPDFKQVVDAELQDMMRSGDMERLYSKWFMEPIPPFSRTVNLPLDDDNRGLYQAPNDRPFN